VSDAGATRVLALVADLMDRSRISAAGVGGVAFVATPAALLARLRDADPAPGVVVLDLGGRGVMGSLSEIRAATTARIVGFGAHVERDLLDDARAAGCDDVLARSAFFARLAAVLTRAP
jgi:DNA-binding NarL/FixJ family response regulator